MEMDLMTAFMGLTTLLGVVNFVYTVNATRSRASKQELDTLHQRINRHGNRLTALEGELRHLPKNSEIKELSDQLSNLNGEVREMIGEFRYVRRRVDSLGAYLNHTGAKQ